MEGDNEPRAPVFITLRCVCGKHINVRSAQKRLVRSCHNCNSQVELLIPTQGAKPRAFVTYDSVTFRNSEQAGKRVAVESWDPYQRRLR